MELSLSGNALKTLARSITCLARIGNELAIQASPSRLAFHTLNSSRSAYQSFTFKPDFFDVYTISGGQVQASVLLKAICSVLRSPMSGIDNLCILLPDPDAPKMQWTLNCISGVKKAYWITCNVEPDIQQLSLDRRKLPSNFVVRPRDLSRLLGNFQANLQEITIIATEHAALPPDVENEIGGKAVEFRSYIDPTKDNDSSLHTQLWIDPTEEFVHYTHSGDPVDVTFGMKELKAFLSLCEACEVDVHLYFEKAGEPILMAPKFGLDDSSLSNFDTTIVLATMLASQLHRGASAEPQQMDASHDEAQQGPSMQDQRSKADASQQPSDHTRIWSELSGSVARSNNTSEVHHARGEGNQQTIGQTEIQRIGAMHISKDGPSVNVRTGQDNRPPTQRNQMEENHGRPEVPVQPSQRHPSNWVDANEDDDDDDGEDTENDLCVQSTPPCYED